MGRRFSGTQDRIIIRQSFWNQQAEIRFKQQLAQAEDDKRISNDQIKKDRMTDAARHKKMMNEITKREDQRETRHQTFITQMMAQMKALVQSQQFATNFNKP